ncbi:polysaccharide deacetylase family protein [Candidatus Woesearchaeota archaeon]|nr:polysaccharide deacetylase family protein [Candidatus Woesearchaeota archaeon]MBW3021727.1 polysaccharide deacetylase family protein [Candidatus Woesearchaeota archaeon]
MKRIMTVDLEYDFETQGVGNLQLLPKILDFFDNQDIKATFFVVGSLTETHEDVIKSIPSKHELASHSFSHRRLSKLSTDALEYEIRKSKEVLGKSCVGFRAPFYIFDKRLFPLLKKNGYQYDSSLSTFFPGRYFHLFSSTKPHMLNGLEELPIPNFFPKLLPAGLSYYRLFYPFSKLFRVPYMIYLHPCEFLNKKMSDDIGFFVRKLYGVNTGNKAWSIFENLIRQLDCKWVTCKNFLDSKSFPQPRTD